MDLNKDLIKETIKRNMATWVDYHPSQHIGVFKLKENHWSLCFNRSSSYLYWDANIIKQHFFLLAIRIPLGIRGKGYGQQLYERIELIAKDLGCKKIVQTPSGTTYKGDTRYNYCIRHGWLDWGDGTQVYKDLV